MSPFAGPASREAPCCCLLSFPSRNQPRAHACIPPAHSGMWDHTCSHLSRCTSPFPPSRKSRIFCSSTESCLSFWWLPDAPLADGHAAGAVRTLCM